MTNRTAKKPSVDQTIFALHAELAAKAFARHVVTQELDNGVFRSWLCKDPERGFHWFRVTTIPGSLIITGDVGDLIVTRTHDMIEWARNSIRDPHYFAEKVPHSIPTEEWSFDKSIEWINEQIRECEASDEPIDHHKCPICSKQIPVLQSTGAIATHDWPPGCRSVCRGSGKVVTRKHQLVELLYAANHDGLNGNMSEHEFNAALYESGLEDGSDWPNLKVFNSNFLWCREAVKWLLQAIPKEQPK